MVLQPHVCKVGAVSPDFVPSFQKRSPPQGLLPVLCCVARYRFALQRPRKGEDGFGDACRVTIHICYSGLAYEWEGLQQQWAGLSVDGRSLRQWKSGGCGVHGTSSSGAGTLLAPVCPAGSLVAFRLTGAKPLPLGEQRLGNREAGVQGPACSTTAATF